MKDEDIRPALMKVLAEYISLKKMGAGVEWVGT